MALSQFDKAVLGGDPEGRGGAPTITVGGPLLLDPRGKYHQPVAIHFVIIQSPKDDHSVENARRVRGMAEATVDPNDPDARWDKTITFEPGKLVEGDARGIGVAVIESTDRFAYESFTWCDHIKIAGPDQVQQSGVQQTAA